MDGEIVIGTKLETKSFDKQIVQLEDKLEDMEKAYSSSLGRDYTKEDEEEFRQLGAEIERTKNKIISLKEKQLELYDSQRLSQVGFASIKGNIENIGNSISKVIKKISKWALAVFGIRSAYLAVRSAMNTLTQYDSQLKADIDYIKNAIAFALEPIVRKIVEWAKLLLSYVGYIIKLFTGHNIFENANKNLSSANKSAKDLRKTLAGFDEMNVLSDSGGVGILGNANMNPDNIFANLDMNNFINKGKEIASKIALGINNFFKTIDWEKLGEGLSLAIMGFIEIISVLIHDIDWASIGQSIADFLLSIDWLGIASSIIELLFEGLIAGLDLMAGVTTGIIDKLTDPKFYSDLFESGKKIFEKVAEGMSEVDASLEKVWKKIISFFLKKLGIKDNDAEKVGGYIGEGIYDGIDNMLEKLPFFGTFYKIIKYAKQAFGVHSPSKEFQSIGENLMLGLENGLKNSANKVIDFLNRMIDKINGVLNFKWNDIKIAGVKLLSAGSINVGKIPKIPRLAKGGVVNYPGKGVPVGSAITGESGKEGVIPLTDSQQMQLLGEAIGRYININATIPVYVANRQIAKEIRRINAEDDFAFNR